MEPLLSELASVCSRHQWCLLTHSHFTMEPAFATLVAPPELPGIQRWWWQQQKAKIYKISVPHRGDLRMTEEWDSWQERGRAKRKRKGGTLRSMCFLCTNQTLGSQAAKKAQKKTLTQCYKFNYTWNEMSLSGKEYILRAPTVGFSRGRREKGGHSESWRRKGTPERVGSCLH